MNTYWVRYAFPSADVPYRRHSVSSVQADSLAQAATMAQEKIQELGIGEHEIISIHNSDEIEDVVLKPFF